MSVRGLDPSELKAAVVEYIERHHGELAKADTLYVKTQGGRVMWAEVETGALRRARES